MNHIFYEIFEKLPRLGPGNNQATIKAFQIINSHKSFSPHCKTLDIGCGTGIHTLQLAKLISGKITALDKHQPFLKVLKAKVEANALLDKIECVVGDMGKMDFEKESFDLLWAEGSIFILGLEKGLKNWYQYLKSNGMIAFSDLFWFKSSHPQELNSFFKQVSPEMMGGKEAIKVIKRSGYEVIDHFPLPSSAWWESFYGPLQEQLKIFRKKYQGNLEAQKTIESLQKEIDIHEKYSDYYGYLFFILKKI